MVMTYDVTRRKPPQYVAAPHITVMVSFDDRRLWARSGSRSWFSMFVWSEIRPRLRSPNLKEKALRSVRFAKQSSGLHSQDSLAAARYL